MSRLHVIIMSLSRWATEAAAKPPKQPREEVEPMAAALLPSEGNPGAPVCEASAGPGDPGDVGPVGRAQVREVGSDPPSPIIELGGCSTTEVGTGRVVVGGQPELDSILGEFVDSQPPAFKVVATDGWTVVGA